ncbi:MAG: hypothetical protein AB7I04_22490 [Pseudomonadales bacterium]
MQRESDSYLFGARNIVILVVICFIGGMFLFSKRSWDFSSEGNVFVPSISVRNDSTEPITILVEETKKYSGGVVPPGSESTVEVSGTGLFTVKAIGADGSLLSEQKISVAPGFEANLTFNNPEWEMSQ